MESTRYLLERVYRLSKIPLRYLDAQTDTVLFSRGGQTDADPFRCDPSLGARLVAQAEKRDIPAIVYEDGCIACAVCPEGGETDRYVLLGPVLLQRDAGFQASAYQKRHGIRSEAFTLRACSLDTLSVGASLAFYAITGKTVSETEIVGHVTYSEEAFERRTSEYQSYVMDEAENDTQHHSYREEQAFFQAILEGDPDAVLARDDVSQLEKVGRLALNHMKQYEYMGVSLIALASRAAIQGGADAATVYAMSDMYALRLEKCTEAEQIVTLCREIMYGFAVRVKETRERRRIVSYVEKCKVYIENHLTKYFTLEDIAKEININPSYLSRRFAESEGVGIQMYTRQKRLEAAANMLRFSDEDIAIIAQYLTFPSQSYFGRVFKEKYGVSPHRYRQMKQLADL